METTKTFLHFHRQIYKMLANWENLIVEVDSANEYNNLTSYMDDNVLACQNDLNNVVKNQSGTIKYHQNNIVKYKSALDNFVKLESDKTNKLKDSENIKESDLNKSRDLVEEYQKQIQKV